MRLVFLFNYTRTLAAALSAEAGSARIDMRENLPAADNRGSYRQLARASSSDDDDAPAGPFAGVPTKDPPVNLFDDL